MTSKNNAMHCGNHCAKSNTISNKTLNLEHWFIEKNNKNILLHFFVTGTSYNQIKNYAIDTYFVCTNGSPYYNCSYEYRNCECHNFTSCTHYKTNIFHGIFEKNQVIFSDKSGYKFIANFNTNTKQTPHEIRTLFKEIFS
jgi:hydroxymethylpyrimidine pyrophosphatase-like HAD family hydrolase